MSKEEIEETKWETVHRRRTDNRMAKRKKNTKGQTTIYKIPHRKLKTHHEPTKNRWLTQVPPKGKQFLLHYKKKHLKRN